MAQFRSGKEAQLKLTTAFFLMLEDSTDILTWSMQKMLYLIKHFTFFYFLLYTV